MSMHVMKEVDFSGGRKIELNSGTEIKYLFKFDPEIYM